MRTLLLSLFLILPSFAVSQYATPKREFRGSWIATVVNLDWPLSPTSTPDVQKAQLINLLDDQQEVGVNAVLFQIRSECDAMYPSSIDPWSYWLTGQQGGGPNPFYDPLQFAIDEAHKRGMELHAWLNPYRVVRNVSGSYLPAPNHISVTRPDLVIQIGNIKFLDPGEPDVRNYIASVVADVVRRYDVDGIHFDDYFY
ncbi:MAG TPA: family 10 glycosylhydrolase, partial [Bacteroidota bacterium]